MEQILDYFYNITAYIGAITLLLGLYYWRLLILPLKIFTIGKCIWQFLTSLSIVLNNYNQSTNFLIYLNCLSAICIYSLFYKNLLNFKYSNIIFLLFPLAFLLYFSFELIKNGVQPYFVLPFTVIDILMLPMAIIVYQKQSQNVSIRYLNISLIINFTCDLAFAIVTSNLHNYFQNKVYTTIFNGISPIYNLIIICFQTYAFYLVRKQKQPTFANNPNFE